jgi:transcriptional regulator NrdR family protein
MLKCPNCNSPDHSVYNSRLFDKGIKRHRRCANCNQTFSTMELISGAATTDHIRIANVNRRRLALMKVITDWGCDA